MRTYQQVSTVTLALALSACGTRQEQPTALSDDLKKDLAVASTSAGDLAPQRYQRMRFVSGVEQFQGAAPAKSRTTTRHTTRAAGTHRVAAKQPENKAPHPVTTETADAAVAESSTESSAVETTNVIVQQPERAPARETAPIPMGTADGSGNEGRGSMGGMGGMGGIGTVIGIIGGAVLRGGSAGVDHCDPRTDGRGGIQIGRRPDLGMPLPTGGGIFGGRGRH